ncbi:hypothetical protein NFI96_015563, partial [Prochilodus magdalenae]
EKTEVLSDDLLQVEKRLELVKQVSHSTHKKLTACLQGQQGLEVDKRSVRSPSKKLPLTTLAQCLIDGAAVLGDDSLLGKMLKLCGETQDQLSQELLLFEVQMEREVIDPLYTLSEVEIPNIQKQRKHLTKLVLDMDSARTRWHQSSKSSTLSIKEQPLGAKADALREELEEAANRMEICRDQLSADMYSFVAKETDYANYFQTLIEVQAEYHRKSLELLQNVLPQIKAQQELWVEKPCFGKPLEEHLSLSGREIAFPIEACVTMLLECGLQEEGLFRIAPSASKLKKLKASLDCGVLDVQEYSIDPHAIAGALKSYLRELPEPLMTFDLYDEWIQASNSNTITKFADDTTIIGNITNDDEGPYREEVKLLTEWCAANNLSLSVSKTKELIVDFRKGGRTHTPLNTGGSEQDQEKRLQSLLLVCEKLPKANSNNFRYLIKFLAKLSEYEDVNKMTAGNIAIVLGPNLLWPQTEGTITDMMTTLSLQIVGIIEPIIQHADWFFPGDIEFNVTGNYGSPLHTNHNSNYSSTTQLCPDTDHTDRKGDHRRPLSVATDNMMLEFYRKDGMGVRVMDSSWVSRRGSSSSSSRKSSSTPPSDSLILEQFGESSTSPTHTPPPNSSDRTSTGKNKELSPVIGQRGLQTSPPTGHTQISEQSPHSMYKAKKLAPVPPKSPYSQSGSMSDPSPCQPSPVSLSPTPPTTPSFGYPQVYATISSPGHIAGALSSPLPLSATLPKVRPISKPPRHRPCLPPPRPPSPPEVESTGNALLDTLSPGESMSTDSLYSPDLPVINIQPDIIEDESPSAPFRTSVTLSESEDE